MSTSALRPAISGQGRPFSVAVLSQPDRPNSNAMRQGYFGTRGFTTAALTSSSASCRTCRFLRVMASEPSRMCFGYELLVCDRGGDHRELVDRARTDRRRLGHNVDESAVLCVRCVKAISLKA